MVSIQERNLTFGPSMYRDVAGHGLVRCERMRQAQGSDQESMNAREQYRTFAKSRTKLRGVQAAP